jgi:hypothetical protein
VVVSNNVCIVLAGNPTSFQATLLYAGFFVCKLKKISNETISGHQDEEEEDDVDMSIKEESFKSHILEDAAPQPGKRKKNRKNKSKDDLNEETPAPSVEPDAEVQPKKGGPRVRGIYKKAMAELKAEMEAAALKNSKEKQTTAKPAKVEKKKAKKKKSSV